MGTDIHLYIEKQDARGIWAPAVCPTWPCAGCAGEGRYANGRPCARCDGKKTTNEPYDVRNYNLFAMLAGVRNGTGFAGVDTGDGFEPLDEPRGLPKDTSIADSENIEYGEPGYVWVGDHSFSHCTLAEVLKYDYDRTTKHHGLVSADEYLQWAASGRAGPSSWSGDVMGRGVRKVTLEKLKRLIEEKASTEGVYALAEWENTYRESAGPSWFRFLDACKTIDRDPAKVRFVFGFDS